MKRMIASLLLFSALALGFADAKPARPLFEPESPPKLPAPILLNLAGTAWLGKFNTVERTYFFEADGSVSYTSKATKAAKVYKQRGSWKFDGVNLFFDHHTGTKKISLEFRGVVKDADTIVGEQSLLLLNTKSPMALKRITMPGK